MVIVAGEPIDTEKLGNQYTPDSVERTIINQLNSSSETYYYDTLDQFIFEVKLRREIIKSANDLSNSELSFAVFRKSKCNEKYWIRTTQGGFLLREGVEPSSAIRDIYINGSQYATEYSTAMVIVYYKALLNIYPEILFNELFTQIQLMNWHYLDTLLKEAGRMKKEADFLPGDRRYFANPDVNPLAFEWQGENVIDLSEGLFYGHGMGILKANQIIDGLNSRRRPNAQISAHLLELVGRPNFKKLFDVYSKSIT